MSAVAADRDLLFGLLALQNGLIDQAKLVAASRPGPSTSPARSSSTWS
jgi:hypothetical protein